MDVENTIWFYSNPEQGLASSEDLSNEIKECSSTVFLGLLFKVR